MGQSLALSSRPARAESFIALLLGLVFPGWGHVYLGRVRRFAAAAGVYVAFAGTLAATGALSTFDGMVANLSAAALLWAGSAADAAHLARVPTRSRRRRWPDYVAWWVGIVCLWGAWIAAREPLLGYGVFRMMAETMTPAVNAREIVLVDTRAFRERPPAAGDVVVVRRRRDRARYLRRIAGVEPDGTITLTAERSATGPGPADCAAGDIVGRATYVLWSPTPGRSGDVVR